MLMGVEPFRGGTGPAVVVAIDARKYIPPSVARPGIAAERVDAFFARAFARDVSARFSSALALADAFEHACRGDLARGAPAPKPISTEPGGPIDVPDSAIVSNHGTAPGISVREGTRVSSRTAAPPSVAPRSASLAWLAAGALGAALIGGGIFVAVRSSGTRRHASDSARATTETPKMHATSAVSPDGRAPFVVTPGSAPKLVSVPRGASSAAGAWLGAFTLHADERSAASLFEAYRACRATRLVVCSEAQWQAACERAPALGSARAWTARIANGRAIARGGGTCANVGPANPGDSLGVACCDPGVATVGTSEAFLHATNDKLVAYQSALDASDPDRATGLVDDVIVFLGNPITRAKYHHDAVGYFHQHPATLMYDRCAVEVRKDEDGWRAVCGLLMEKDGRLVSLEQTLHFGGPLGKLQRIDEGPVRNVE